MNLKIILLIVALSTVATPVYSSGPIKDCPELERSRAVAQMSIEERKARRQRIMESVPEESRAALCKSSTMITHDGYREQLQLSEELNRQARGAEYGLAELYFFVVCGEDMVGMSPLAYHAFNLNRDDHGFLGEMTLAILWMSVGYLDVDDPDSRRSFMGSIDRILNSARKRESEAEIRMYEDLLSEIEGFREDHLLALEQCGLAAQPES